MIELENCPLCGAPAKYNEFYTDAAECSDPNCPIYKIGTHGVDAKHWNRRPKEEALRNSRKKEIHDLLDQLLDLEAKYAWHPESEKPPKWQTVLLRLTAHTKPHLYKTGYWTGSFWTAGVLVTINPIAWQYIEEA